MAVREQDWRPAVARVIGDRDAFAADLAAGLDEPLDEVRATARLWLFLHSVAADTGALEAIVTSLRLRARGPWAVRQGQRSLDADTFEDLLAKAQRRSRGRPPDASLVVEVQHAAGAIAARSGMRLVVFLARLAYSRRWIWDRCVAEFEAGRLDAPVLVDLGEWLLLWTELTSLAVTEGYRAAEREILARDADARRAALDELLGVLAIDPPGITRARRVAARFGLDPELAYRLVVVAPGPEADPTPDQPGLDRGDLELLASRIGHLLGSPSAAAEGAGSGIRLPAVLAMRGRIVILARADWVGQARIPAALDRVLGGAAAGSGDPAELGPRASGVRSPVNGTADRPAVPAWLAVESHVLGGVTSLAGALADILDAVRTAELIGRRGWIHDPDALAVERLLLASPELGEAAVARELGPLLGDERLGEELVETLQVYFDAGENMRETARRLHLANRTVAYRIERIETLLGAPLDGELRRRVAVALLVRRLQSRLG
jgi:hypothetical protein